MAFYLYFACGIVGGLLGGMGMGGGTLLIPLLTLLCKVPQGVAQGVNLLSFLPMSWIALNVHAKSGRLEKRGLAFIALPALVFSGLFAFFAAYLPGEALRRGFGFFLILLSIFPFSSALKAPQDTKKFSEN